MRKIIPIEEIPPEVYEQLNANERRQCHEEARKGLQIAPDEPPHFDTMTREEREQWADKNIPNNSEENEVALELIHDPDCSDAEVIQILLEKFYEKPPPPDNVVPIKPESLEPFDNEPAPHIEEPAPHIEETAPHIEEPAPHIEEPAPHIEEPPHKIEELLDDEQLPLTERLRKLRKSYEEMPTEVSFSQYPLSVDLNEDLSHLDRLIFWLVKSLDGDRHCYASNGYFSHILHKHQTSITRSINKLIRLGYLKLYSKPKASRRIIGVDHLYGRRHGDLVRAFNERRRQWVEQNKNE